MHHVTIRSRSDGITELGPKLAPLDASDRLLVIVTVILVTAGFFMSGLMPPEAFAAVVLSSVAGEIVLGVKALVLLALRPAAEVHEVPRVARLHRR
jgi:hypothetical protein